VNFAARRAVVGFSGQNLDSCHGSVPTPDCSIELSWTRRRDRLDYRLTAPPGCPVEIVNDSSLRLQAR
jgi:hypothetical protein